MAFPTLPSTSQIPEIKKEEDEEFDLMKNTKIEVGKQFEEVNIIGGVFAPNEDDLVAYYLFNKILDRVLPITNIIKEIDDLYEYDPNQLPVGDFIHGNKWNEAFYFTYVQQVYSIKGKVTKRTTRGGYWKPSGKEEELKFRQTNITVGFKNFLVFHRGQAPNGSRTGFVMHEYRINPFVVPVHVLNDTIRKMIERHVVCRITNRGLQR